MPQHNAIAATTSETAQDDVTVTVLKAPSALNTPSTGIAASLPCITQTASPEKPCASQLWNFQNAATTAGDSGLQDGLKAAACQQATIHLQTNRGDGSSILTNSGELQISRLEQQESIKVLQLAFTSSSNPPSLGEYEVPVADMFQITPGEHVWVIAKHTGMLGYAYGHKHMDR